VTRRSLLRCASGVIGLLIPEWTRVVTRAQTEGPRAGAVEGIASGSGRSPSSPPSPMTGLTVVLLPPSDSLLAELERRRHQSRESLAAYRAAIPDMRRLVEAAVAKFRAAGQGEAIRSASADAAGRFSISGVSPGTWILIGQRAIHVDRTSSDTARESGTFLPQSRLVGYDRVLVWLRTIVVEPGRAAPVEITDRNVWFEGVEEQTAARERAPNTGSRRRSAR
jgi:hypothetical protein